MAKEPALRWFSVAIRVVIDWRFLIGLAVLLWVLLR